MNHQQFDALPSRPGVYKFQNLEGRVIYIGKARNIKKRVLGHFRSISEKERTLCEATSSVDFELTGSELIAFLLEAELIQKHLPTFNTVQMKLRTAFHIIAQNNKKGILQLSVEPRPSLHEQKEVFFTQATAKKKLEKLCEEYDLCPKYSGLQQRRGRCDQHKYPYCLGVCCGKEEIYTYNQRAEQAFARLKADTDSYVIIEKGRIFGELGVVIVREGIYQGFGYTDGSQQITTIDEIMDLVRPRKHTYHTAQILQSYRKKYPGSIKVLEMTTG